jgi:hypothetical protein
MLVHVTLSMPREGRLRTRQQGRDLPTRIADANHAVKLRASSFWAAQRLGSRPLPHCALTNSLERQFKPSSTRDCLVS